MLKRILISFLLVGSFSQSSLAMEPNDLAKQLYLATKYQDAARLQQLINDGANVNCIGDEFGRTCLMEAAELGWEDGVRLLLDSGAEVNQQANRGGTALMGAAKYCQPHIVRLLIERNANVELATKFGETPLMCAAQGDYEGRNYDAGEILMPLVNAGANILRKVKVGRRNSVLGFAAFHNNTPICEWILSHVCLIPFKTNLELQKSQEITRLRLWALKNMFPGKLPKEIVNMILTCEAEIFQDACNTPLHFHTNEYGRVKHMPVQILHTLIKNNALDFDRTVETLYNYTCECITPLMLEALPLAKTDEMKAVLDPERRKDYGETIRENILKKLLPGSNDHNNNE